MSIESNRNDISTEPSPEPGEGDNLGAEDGKGDPPTVVPSDSEDTDAAEDTDDSDDTAAADVLAEDPSE
ncbi:hypothetical protein [Microbacterium sp.]|uniref:hypothetical protein n=1 Tax=Microbacterium sp. TaxID=51671 RepID=UPI003A9446CC